MPIYEYRCNECGEKFDLFVRSMSEQGASVCPKCGSQQVQKDISLFGVGSTSGIGLNAPSCGPGPT
jgi:putative FmdB family regulatory protein